MRKVTLLLFILLCCISNAAQAQMECGAAQAFRDRLRELGITREEYARKFGEQMQKLQHPVGGNDQFLADRVFKVPVVVHILHYAGGRRDYNFSDDAW